MSQPKTAIQTVLLALVPYTKENIKFTMRPKQFFYELERRTGHQQQVLNRAYSRALSTGLIEHTGSRLSFTDVAIKKIKPYTANKLIGNVMLLVVFGIPESKKRERQRFRNFLRYLNFSQVQKSVWQSELDFRDEVIRAADDLHISSYVKMYESAVVL